MHATRLQIELAAVQADLDIMKEGLSTLVTDVTEMTGHAGTIPELAEMISKLKTRTGRRVRSTPLPRPVPLTATLVG